MTDIKYGYVELEVGGIQKYILGTGKLKEMIGGSELIESLASTFLDNYLEDHGFSTVDPTKPREPVTDNGVTEVLPLQRNAGAMHLLFPNLEIAKAFIKNFTLQVLSQYPGIPLFGAVTECEFTSLGIREAKKEVANLLADQRNRYLTASGMTMSPLCVPAPLDGLPSIRMTTEREAAKSEYVSLPSNTRRNPQLLEDAQTRLHNDIEKDIKAGDLEKYGWSEDLEVISGGLGKVAFIHLDGNDLGKLFRTELQNRAKKEEEQQKELEKKALLTQNTEAVAEGDKKPKKESKKDKKNKDKFLTPEQKRNNAIYSIKAMGSLSKIVKDTTTSAFNSGIKAIIDFDTNNHKKIIPARPLVLGGDDVTIVMRADLALIFIDAFILEFESYSEKALLERKNFLNPPTNGNNKTPYKRPEKEFLSVGVGMVVCPTSYPFLKAFNLSEELLKNAKELTANQQQLKRRSSIDYVVITNETENTLDSIREHLYTTDDGQASLTAKPIEFNKDNNNFARYIRDGVEVLDKLPRSALRNALNDMKKGIEQSKDDFEKVADNIRRKLGGRTADELLTEDRFKELFPNTDGKGFFFKEGTKFKTRLGDYLELDHLIKADAKGKHHKIMKYFEGL